MRNYLENDDREIYWSWESVSFNIEDGCIYFKKIIYNLFLNIILVVEEIKAGKIIFFFALKISNFFTNNSPAVHTLQNTARGNPPDIHMILF